MSNEQLPEIIDKTELQKETVYPLIEMLTLNVREDMKENVYLEEALRVLPVGGHRSAIGAFWNAVIDDLRNKIIYRSLAMFNKEMNLGRDIKTYDDFQNYVNDDQLIEGAYKIGVIGWEASKVLKHAKETRHIFSGHPKSTDPSIIKVYSMMDDCIKYVLNIEFPPKIVDINEYMEILATENYDRSIVGIETALGDLPDIYKNELINRLFTSYIHQNSSTILRSNIEICAPILWRIITKENKFQVIRRLDQEIARGDVTSINYGFSFVENVQGNEYLSLNSKKYMIEPLIERLEKNLDDFGVENECVRDLERFADSIPRNLLDRYVNAITQTYVGHTGGSAYYARTDFYADGAALRIPGMFEKFDDASIDSFIVSIKTNNKLQSRIKNPAKLRRLRSLGNIACERSSENYSDKVFLENLVDETKKNEFFLSI